MGGAWWEQQGKSPGDPDLPLVNGDLKLIFYIPDTVTDNWLAGHACCMSKGCCFPSCPILRFQTHIPALRSSSGVGGAVLSGQRCPSVSNIQTKTRTALINTSWFVSGSRKPSVNNLKKKIRSNLKQASLSGKQLSASLIAWKNIFSSQLHFWVAFYVAAHVTPHEDEWAQMWFECLIPLLTPHPVFFSSPMLRQSLISQANKRMEWAFSRWWQILIKC